MGIMICSRVGLQCLVHATHPPAAPAALTHVPPLPLPPPCRYFGRYVLPSLAVTWSQHGVLNLRAFAAMGLAAAYVGAYDRALLLARALCMKHGEVVLAIGGEYQATPRASPRSITCARRGGARHGWAVRSDALRHAPGSLCSAEDAASQGLREGWEEGEVRIQEASVMMRRVRVWLGDEEGDGAHQPARRPAPRPPPVVPHRFG